MALHASTTDMKSDMIRTLDQWWHARAKGDVPDRADLDPADFTRLLPNLFICEVEHAPFRIRFRLVGTRATAVTGFDITGRYLDELVPADTTEDWTSFYQHAYRTRRPVFGVSNAPTTAGGRFIYEFALFPLRRGGDAIDQFVSIEDYLDRVPMSAEFVPWSHIGRTKAG